MKAAFEVQIRVSMELLHDPQRRQGDLPIRGLAKWYRADGSCPARAENARERSPRLDPFEKAIDAMYDGAVEAAPAGRIWPSQ
jgi:hypothetical protein